VGIRVVQWGSGTCSAGCIRRMQRWCGLLPLTHAPHAVPFRVVVQKQLQRLGQVALRLLQRLQTPIAGEAKQLKAGGQVVALLLVRARQGVFGAVGPRLRPRFY
jgi:hypothetical protein